MSHISHPAQLSPTTGRLIVLTAAVLWSLSGAFTNVLVTPTFLGLHEPKLTPIQIASFRVLFAGLVMFPMIRPSDVTFRWATLWTALTFAAMNAMYITAVALGQAANAVLLQYSAPMWLFIVGVCFLGETANRRGVVSLMAGILGVGVILVGGWKGGNALPIVLGIGSGVTFAGVMLGLRAQRDASPAWLTAVNHLCGSLVLLPFALPLGLVDVSWPTLAQLAWLAVFGAVQMGFPYMLMAHALKSVSPQEAATLTLLEPLLMPLWAYLVAPEKERPSVFIFIGGALILAGLAYRYWPARQVVAPEPTPEPRVR